jgi:hypothetical protein
MMPPMIGAKRLRTALAFVLALLSFGFGCGDSSPTPPPGGIRILSFTAEPSSVQSGGTATLRWDTVGASGVSIEPTVGLQPPTGEIEVRVFVSTTYVLTVGSGADRVTSRVSVEVAGGPPRVDAFLARPRTIQLGESATLEWSCSNTTSVSIEPAVGERGPTGSAQVTPDITTTYRLIARGENGTTESEVTVVVASGSQPFIRDFWASKATISAGEAVTLAWETFNTDSVVIDNGVGSQPANGSVEVSPTRTTVYNLTAVGPGGTASASLTIAVDASGTPIIESFEASPTTVLAGGEVTLSWETDNALHVELNHGIGQQQAKGSVVVRPTESTVYVLTAYGQAGNATAEVTVTVAAPNTPVILEFLAQPAAVQRGGSVTLRWTTQNAVSVDIDNGAGTGLPASGTVQVTPLDTTTFTLTARGTNGTATAQRTVTVTVPPPSVTSFGATPVSITLGQSTTLSWQTTDATSVDIDNGAGTGLPASGTVQVSPTTTTRYALVARGPGGQANAEVTVSVAVPGAPVVLVFSASPQTIAPGGSTTLSWSTQGATSVTLDNGLGTQAVTGMVTVSPGQSTTYTLTASGPGGQTTAQVNVSVASPNGDQCSSAFLVTSSGVQTGNTQTAVNDYSQSNSCTGYASTGPDIVYRVPLSAGDRLRASLQPNTSWDASLYLVTSCSNVAQSCVAGQDNGNPEVVDYVAAQAGDHFLIVDGYGSAGGAYTLTIELNPAPIANEQCSGAIDVTAGGTFSGDTRNAINDYDPASGGCTGFAARSKDLAYRVQLAPGERLRASLSAAWDASLYLVTDCGAAAASCVAGQDNGNPEVVDYLSAAGGTFFLIVDGFGSAAGTFDLSITISPPVVGGDVCATAITIPAVGGSFQSTTSGLSNSYSPLTSCTGSANLGPDRVYSQALTAGDVVEALLEPAAGLDASLYVLTNCTSQTCVAGADQGPSGAAENLRFVAQTTGEHYLVVDQKTAGAGGDHELTVARYRGDTCADAIPMLLASTPESFTTVGYTNSYSPNSGGCTGYAAAGPDRAYRVNLQPGDQLQVDVTPGSAWDTSVYMVSNCADVSGSCVQGSDAFTAGGTERLSPVVQQAGSYFVIVDGYLSASGAGSVSAKIARGDTCADPYRVPATGGVFQGTTTGYAADIGTTVSAGSCTGWAQSGADAIYSVTLAAGKRIVASLNSSWDGALYLVRDCAQAATTCVAGQDNGNPEDIDFTATTAGTYFLVVDSWRAGPTYTGNYTLTIQLP